MSAGLLQNLSLSWQLTSGWVDAVQGFDGGQGALAEVVTSGAILVQQAGRY